MRRRLGNSKVLKEDIAHYDRQEGVEGSKEHTYDYLLDCIDRYLRRTGVQQNQQEREKIFELQMKALKDGKNLTPAQIAQQLNVVPAKGGKGDGKSPEGAARARAEMNKEVVHRIGTNPLPQGHRPAGTTTRSTTTPTVDSPVHPSLTRRRAGPHAGSRTPSSPARTSTQCRHRGQPGRAAAKEAKPEERTPREDIVANGARVRPRG